MVYLISIHTFWGWIIKRDDYRLEIIGQIQNNTQFLLINLLSEEIYENSTIPRHLSISKIFTESQPPTPNFKHQRTKSLIISTILQHPTAVHQDQVQGTSIAPLLYNYFTTDLFKLEKL